MDNIILTIDVEDWFQVENFKPWVPFSSWPSWELRVERNTNRLLDLFDTVVSTRSPISDSRSPIRATFFILGWIAERLPNVVREIHDRGHEVASHGYYHKRCDQQTFDELKKDLIDSKKILEDTIGVSVFGYRAPSFSINNEVLKVIEECGYLYDSSYNSFSLHGRYGRVDFSHNDRKGIAIQISDSRSQIPDHRFYELPISNLKFSTQNPKCKIQNFELPWGGGGYFRMIPFPVFKWGVQSILKKQGAYVFYMHPWEIDPEQPQVSKASAGYKFRHYVNLGSTHSKLSNLLGSLRQHDFITCRQYTTENEYHN